MLNCVRCVFDFRKCWCAMNKWIISSMTHITTHWLINYIIFPFHLGYCKPFWDLTNIKCWQWQNMLGNDQDMHLLPLPSSARYMPYICQSILYDILSILSHAMFIHAQWLDIVGYSCQKYPIIGYGYFWMGLYEYAFYLPSTVVLMFGINFHELSDWPTW